MRPAGQRRCTWVGYRHKAPHNVAKVSCEKHDKDAAITARLLLGDSAPNMSAPSRVLRSTSGPTTNIIPLCLRV